MNRLIVALALAAPIAPGPTVARGDEAGSRARDLETLRTEYVEHSLAFTASARARARRFIEDAMPRAATMTREQFLLTVMRVTGLADNGHDGLNDRPGAWFPEKRLPIRMLWFPDGWLVVRAAPEYQDLLGARVRTIEGNAPGAVLAKIRLVIGGTDDYRRWDGEWLVENAGMLQALGIARRTDGLELALTLKDGRHERRVVPFVANDSVPQGGGAVRVWVPAPWPRDAETGWRSALAEPGPLYLQDGFRWRRLAPLPDLDALYVQFRSHAEDDEETMAPFLAEVDAALAARHPRSLIVDLRFDTGGNSDLTREWIRTIPARVPGSIYLLTGPYTFSAGIVSAAAFKHDGGAKVKIVGEPVGDRLTWWSEGHDACLAFSNYCPHVTTGQWNLEHGCAAVPGCYGDRYDVTVGSLAPDLPAPLTAAAWLAGRDPALEAIRAELAKH